MSQLQVETIFYLDIKDCFTLIDHKIIQDRVRDAVVCRQIGKRLNAGVLGDGICTAPKIGVFQRGVIPPC